MKKARTKLNLSQRELNLNMIDNSCIENVKHSTEDLIRWNDLKEKVLVQRAKIEG